MTKELTLNKIAAALVGVAMVAGLAFAAAAERAHAITLSELVELFIALEVIPADKADEARAVLTGQDETPAAGGSTMTCNFTRNLTVGDTGTDVMDLQKLLNSKGFTVAAAGAGSPGNETQYFGSMTAAAVSAMQNAFASEILAPLGLTSGTGYFGASTRAKANALCSTGTGTTPPPPPPPPGMGDDDDMMGDDDDDTTLSGGEVSLEDFKRLGAPASVDVGENETRTQVAGWEFDVKDADGSLRRVDINFEATAGSANYSLKPYEYFESVALYLDGERIAEENADNKDDWSDLAGNVWQMRFSGLSEFLEEDSNPEIVVAVTTVGNLDTEDEATTWNVFVANNGVRVRDGAGIDQYVGDADTLGGASYSRTFTTEGAGANDELKVALSSSNPDASIIKVDTDSTTQDVTILVFTMKAEGNDVTIDTLPITFTVPATEEFDEIVTDVTLDIDGELFSDFTTASSTTAGTATTTFDINEDVTIPEDDTVTVKVIVDLNSLTGNYAAGTTLSASVPGYGVDDITGTAGDDLSASTNSGSATGETHQLQSEGIFAEIVSITETSKSDGTNDDAVGEFKFKFDVTAFDDTFYVSATSTGVIGYTVYDDSGASTTLSESLSLTSGATKESSTAYRVDDGATEEFTFTVTFDAPVLGYYHVTLDSITFGTTAALPYGSSHTAAPASDFESDDLYLNV